MVSHIPENIAARVAEVQESLLPKKSRPLYEKEFNQFQAWLAKQKVDGVNEEILMGYFHELVRYYYY